MRKSRSGFTIVELLIVIVVIAILAAIVIVAYNGIQSRARNAVRYSEVQEWEKLFQIYYATYGSTPPVDFSKHYCLGTGFPNGGYCRDSALPEYEDISYPEATNTDLMNEIKKVGTIPTHNPPAVNGDLVGPYVAIWDKGVYITQAFEGTKDDCPSGLHYEWDDNEGSLLCSVEIDW